MCPCAGVRGACAGNNLKGPSEASKHLVTLVTLVTLVALVALVAQVALVALVTEIDGFVARYWGMCSRVRLVSVTYRGRGPAPSCVAGLRPVSCLICCGCSPPPAASFPLPASRMPPVTVLIAAAPAPVPDSQQTSVSVPPAPVPAPVILRRRHVLAAFSYPRLQE